MIEDTAPDSEEQDEELAGISRDAAPWVSMLKESEKVFAPWNEECDRIDKLYGSLKLLAGDSSDREMQMLWASMEVIIAVIYARPPVPLVSPRHRDRKELPRRAADLLERALSADFEVDDVDGTMQAVRDDVPLNGRGVARVRYDVGPDGEVATCEHIERDDFRHGAAKKWKNVPWAGFRSHLNYKAFKKRFPDASWMEANPEHRGIGSEDEDEKASDERTVEVWEVWHKEKGVIAFVSMSAEKLLDLVRPPVNLTGFFDCPKPAYGTLQRKTLIPVPDYLYIRDQLEEINTLTGRISALSEALKVRGFYASGSKDFAEALESAFSDMDDRQIMVPVPAASVAAAGAKMSDAVVWLPIEDIVVTLRELIALRRQVIDDIYQIYGLSDIMRGETEASETATAQQIKAQYGGIRVRRRQKELVRFARDIARIKAEIMAEAFEPQTLLAMSQVDDLPSAQDIQQKIAMVKQQAVQQAQQAMADPKAQQMAQQNPQQAQQMMAQAQQQVQQQVQELQNTVTVEAVMQLYRSERLRPFVLEIETDSTIEPDEQAAKQRATEFAGAMGQLMQGGLPLVQALPQAADMVVSMIRFTASTFRSNREVDSAIDEFAEKMKGVAEQASQAQQGPSPEQVKAEADAKARQAELQMKQQEAQMNAQAQQQKMQADIQAAQAKMQTDAELERERMQNDMQIAMAKMTAELQMKEQQMEREFALKREAQQMDAELKRDTAAAQVEIAERTAAAKAKNGDARA